MCRPCGNRSEDPGHLAYTALKLMESPHGTANHLRGQILAGKALRMAGRNSR